MIQLMYCCECSLCSLFFLEILLVCLFVLFAFPIQCCPNGDLWSKPWRKPGVSVVPPYLNSSLNNSTTSGLAAGKQPVTRTVTHNGLCVMYCRQTAQHVSWPKDRPTPFLNFCPSGSLSAPPPVLCVSVFYAFFPLHIAYSWTVIGFYFCSTW